MLNVMQFDVGNSDQMNIFTPCRPDSGCPHSTDVCQDYNIIVAVSSSPMCTAELEAMYRVY